MNDIFLLELSFHIPHCAELVRFGLDEDRNVKRKISGIDSKLDVGYRTDPHAPEYDRRADVQAAHGAIEIHHVCFRFGQELAGAKEKNSGHCQSYSAQHKASDEGLVSLFTH